MDIRHLVKGSTLMLPVCVPGALFSCGDGHAAQGDGEICLTAIETAVRPTLRFTVVKGQDLPEPHFVLRSPASRPSEGKGYFATTATGNDLFDCAQRAVRYMIDHVEASHGLTREEGYVLCSIAVDLKISEIVNYPNWLVSAYLPLDVFVAGSA